MSYCEAIKKQKQLLARGEQALALVKLKKRRADARRKIELGGLVIKAGMGGFDKSIILGALDYSCELLKQESYRALFESRGQDLFLLNLK